MLLCEIKRASVKLKHIINRSKSLKIFIKMIRLVGIMIVELLNSEVDCSGVYFNMSGLFTIPFSQADKVFIFEKKNIVGQRRIKKF